MALSTRLYITCVILPLSALTNCSSPEKVSWNCIFFFLHNPSNVSIVCFIIELISKVVISKETVDGSSSLSVSILLVSFVRRSVSNNNISKYFPIISGGIVPSDIASRYPLIEVKGERKSCDMFDRNFCWNCSPSFNLLAI